MNSNDYITHKTTEQEIKKLTSYKLYITTILHCLKYSYPAMWMIFPNFTEQ